MFGCSQFLQAMTRSGSLSYLDGPQSDHRGLFVDIDPNTILGQPLTTQNIDSPRSRSLKSGNPELVEAYHEAMKQYYKEHKMVERMQQLFSTHTTLSRSKLKKKLEQWDQDQGRAMANAERIITKPRKPYAWSPTLRDAGLLYRYWRLRYREEKHDEDYATTFDRIEQLAQQSNTKFVLPLRSVALTLDQVTTNLNSAATHLRKCQKNSIDIRFSSYVDLLAKYETDTNSETMKQSKHKAGIVRNTIRSEQCRTMYSNIRQVVKPNLNSGFQDTNTAQNIHKTFSTSFRQRIQRISYGTQSLTKIP